MIVMNMNTIKRNVKLVAVTPIAAIWDVAIDVAMDLETYLVVQIT